MNMEGGLAPQQSWWSRNWKWVVGGGCLGILLSCGCLGAVIFGVTYSALKSTGVYTDAVAAATQSPEVREALGEPVSAGFMMTGSVNVNDDGGRADFSVPLQGSKKEGSLKVKAFKRGGDWSFTTLQVEVPGQGPIDVLANAPRPEIPPESIPSEEGPPGLEPPEHGAHEDPHPDTGEPVEPEPSEEEAPDGKKDIQL
jgi:hypothetical protein